jgi:hypothetical protein
MSNLFRFSRIRWRQISWDDVRHRLSLAGGGAPRRRTGRLWLLLWLAAAALLLAALILVMMSGSQTGMPVVRRY